MNEENEEEEEEEEARREMVNRVTLVVGVCRYKLTNNDMFLGHSQGVDGTIAGAQLVYHGKVSPRLPHMNLVVRATIYHILGEVVQ